MRNVFILITVLVLGKVAHGQADKPLRASIVAYPQTAEVHYPETAGYNDYPFDSVFYEYDAENRLKSEKVYRIVKPQRSLLFSSSSQYSYEPENEYVKKTRVASNDSAVWIDQTFRNPDSTLQGHSHYYWSKSRQFINSYYTEDEYRYYDDSLVIYSYGDSVSRSRYYKMVYFEKYPFKPGFKQAKQILFQNNQEKILTTWDNIVYSSFNLISGSIGIYEADMVRPSSELPMRFLRQYKSDSIQITREYAIYMGVEVCYDSVLTVFNSLGKLLYREEIEEDYYDTNYMDFDGPNARYTLLNKYQDGQLIETRSEFKKTLSGEMVVSLWAFYDYNLSPSTMIDHNAQNLMVYPNPATDYIYVRMGDRHSSFDILDAQGKLIRHVPEGSQSVLISDLPAGLYMLRTHNERGSFVRAFLKD